MGTNNLVAHFARSASYFLTPFRIWIWFFLFFSPSEYCIFAHIIMDKISTTDQPSPRLVSQPHVVDAYTRRAPSDNAKYLYLPTATSHMVILIILLYIRARTNMHKSKYTSLFYHFEYVTSSNRCDILNVRTHDVLRVLILERVKSSLCFHRKII